MKRAILCAAFVLSDVSRAQSIVAPSIVEPNMAESHDEFIRDEDDGDQWQNPELDLDQDELRPEFDRGFGLSIGSTAPWQDLALSAHLAYEPGLFYGAAIGFGQDRSFGSLSNGRYQVRMSSRTVNGSVKWFMTKIMPLALTGGAGLVAWDGTYRPSQTVVEESVPEVLPSSFSGWGGYGFSTLSLVYFAKNGFYCEYTLFGIGYSGIWQLTQGGKDRSDAVIRKTLNGVSSWGFINITIGWFLRGADGGHRNS